MSFQIALSGLDAASTSLEVTSNNIANSRTNGFKEARAEFGDVFATSINDSSATAPGRGVRVNKIAQQFSQGTVDFTSRNLDLAINGDGFFVLQGDDGGIEYTRAGAYSSDKDGFIVNHKLQKLQVYPAVTVNGVTSFTTGVLRDLQLPLANSAPNQTLDVTTAINLDAAAVPPASPFQAAPASQAAVNAAVTAGTIYIPGADEYNYSTSTTVYDSLGDSHTLSMYFIQTGTPNEWSVQTLIDGYDVTNTTTAPANTSGNAIQNNLLVFDSTGALDPAASGAMEIYNATFGGALPLGQSAATSQDGIRYTIADMTQYGGDYAVSNIVQDGFATGRLAGLDIDAEGVAFARYTNGQATALGKVALAKFNSPQNLSKVGDTNWAESFASGQALLGEATTSSFGSIQSGALEASNVDLAEQLVNLIVSQRAFQANSKVVTSVDQILQTIINI
ncbi:MAG: flagellar hook protein FlgE [Gammaproteobacteria bacterium]|nr:flagellar hook protein FlgE [Gammaproteobacteria bacterium]NNJ91089.1 flagellar hook protein FlgE [Gammaproteobacteria bacterium]